MNVVFVVVVVVLDQRRCHHSTPHTPAPLQFPWRAEQKQC